MLFPDRAGDDFNFAEEVAGAAGRLLGRPSCATALHRFERNPIAKNIPPPSILSMKISFPSLLCTRGSKNLG